MKIIADENIPFVRQACELIPNADVELVAGRAMTAETVRLAQALLVRSVTKVGPALLEGSEIKFVATATIGTDHIDLDYLKDKDIAFTSAPGSNADSVAEYITAALLEIGHKKNITLKGKSIGIIGVGNVGSRVVKKALALGMKPVLNDPPLLEQTGDDKYRDINELYDCDFITVHTPLTRDGKYPTYHLCDDNFFKSLKQGSVFLNTSRGPVCDTAALKSALESGKVSAAAIDVWENEPTIDTQLLNMVDIATPHIAGYSYDGKVRGMVMIYNAMCDFFGIDIKCKEADFLPAPAVPTIELLDNLDTQVKIFQAVKAVYDIMADDARCRQIASADIDRAGKFFDDLRKNYPVRREFANTKIFNQSKTDEQIFKALGFRI